jgi:mRNA-degrading endonuclease toxin of MazEF toxin-antitoxin module
MKKFRYKKVEISPSVWQIWLVYVKFIGEEGGKKRPVLITDVDGEECSVMEISSQAPQYITDVLIKDLDSAGLERESVVQVRKQKTISKDSLTDYRGYLSREDRNRVNDARRFF